jgi:copper chaperone CopZ
MTCSLCTLAVKKSLSAVEGVNNVDVSYKKKRPG